MNFIRHPVYLLEVFLAAALVIAPPAWGQATGTAGVPSPRAVVTDDPVVSAPEPQPQSLAKPTVAVSAYRINAGDELEIYTWGEERLQRTVRVLPDGTFAFPLVGQIVAQGRLPQEIEAIIVTRLRDQYRGQVPQVTVSVKSPAGLQFSVMGKVRSPGTFTPGRYVSVIEALSLAGGPAEFANLDDVLLIRKSGARFVASRIRLGGLFRGGASAGALDRANIISIETGDTIIVP